MRNFSIRQTLFRGHEKTDAGKTTDPSDLPGIISDDQRRLGQDESILYLRKLFPAPGKSTDLELGHLADCLGNQAFALSVAGGYLRERPRTTAGEYLAEIQKTAPTLSSTVRDWVQNSQEPLTTELAAAITMSWRLLEGKAERERLARMMFFVSGYLAPGLPVPPELLRLSLEIENNKQSSLERSLQLLYSLGFLRQTDEGPVINLILAGFARIANPEPARILTLIAEVYTKAPMEPASPVFSTPSAIEHLRALALYVEDAYMKPAGALWNSLGFAMWAKGDFSESKACLERSLAFNERLYGTEHADTAIALSNLGRVLSDLGDLKGARNCYERAMAINEKVFSAFYPEVATNANDLGQVLYESGDLPGAKACFERALSIHESAFGYGPKHPIIASEAGNLGRTLRDLGDLQGAKKNFERALAIDEWTHGPKYPGLANRANYLGRVLYQLGDLQGAKANFERAVAIEKANPEAERTILANVLNNLALVQQDLGNLADARDCFEQVLAIDEKEHGPEHPTVAKDIASLGNIQRDLGNYASARDYFERAIKINEAIYGSAHPTTAANVKNLGRVLYKIGDLSGAKKAYERAVEIDTKLLEADHIEIGTDVHNLGMVLFEMGELQEAKASYERALSIFEKKYGADHAKTVKAKQHLDRVKKRMMGG